jgi:DeoR/GlpR family transcriptional regulator of sugar metabolism
MFAEERLQQIVELLKKDGKVFVKDLSIKFGVTDGMIRKDLQRLEKEEKIKRTHGGAILKRNMAETTSISNRMIKNISFKKAIAEKAFDLIEENDIIFLDISSINFILAEVIAKSNKAVTLLTNMVELTSFFKDTSTVTVICIGGIYNKKLGGVVGSEAIESIAKYRVNKAFIGSCGVNLQDQSISNFDLEEGHTKKAIIAAAKSTYIVMENEKFYYDGTYRFAYLKDIDGIITQESPALEINEFMKKHHLQLL